MKVVNQLVAYFVFFALLGILSVKPALHLLRDDEAMVSLSFTHSGKRIGECRRLSQEELMALPPNMRKPDDCPRQRHPIVVELVMDGELLYRATLSPSGIWQDGKASVYQRLRISAGPHELAVRMNDSGQTASYDFEYASSVDVRPGQNLVVFFDNAAQRFEFW